MSAQSVFVGYDDVCDYVWDMLPPGEEGDYNTTLITEGVIERLPALIGWHAEVAKGAAIEAILSDEVFWEIAKAHQFQ